MKIVVGGQIDKEKVKEILEKKLSNTENLVIDIKSDIEAAMLVKQGQYDYYFGACNTGGGALAMAIALLGADKCLTVAMPGNVISEEKVKEGIEKGKIAFGFTPYSAENSIEMIIKYLNI